ncbi:uroporphyrinogen-III synthase [Cognatilysobacter bugurensis]|uniref:uroporphyrinogen-III synthase n=1 Tax=Cognatilysobacter bugurensis TaxID=543356 RepID=UPI001E611269|nr:uroporphyrinogen-III synthase [Lysobacter bugurensis]
MISLRPRGEHAGLRAAAARAGAGLIALSPWRLVDRTDAATLAALDAALAAPCVVVTSPTAVRAAAVMRPLRDVQTRWCAVGTGTAAALRRAGVRAVDVPGRMDSEGVLALSALQDVAGCTVGLLTAPGGRDAIAPALAARGAQVQRADVYAREVLAPAPSAVAALERIDAPCALALSSGEALRQVLAALPPAAVRELRCAQAVAASDRLTALARTLGFRDVVRAAGPRPGQLVSAATVARAPR